MKTRLLLLLPALLLGGCISLLPKAPPAPQMLVMEVGDVQRLEGAPIDAVVSVADPDGERAILGEDMVLRTGDSIAFVGGSKWMGRAEDLLQTLLAQTMSRQGRFKAALGGGSGRGAYEVRWQVLSFEVVQGANGGNAHFQADVRLVDNSRRVLGNTLIDTTAPVNGGTASAAAQALTRAAREASARIGVFAADTAAQAQAQAARDQSRAASTSR